MKNLFKSWRLAFATAVLALLSACSHTVLVAPGSNAIAPGNKIPLDVGLVLTEELRRYQHSESKMGDTWVYQNLGQASADHFRNYLEARFTKVTVLNAMPAPAATAPYSALIEPKISGFTFDIPITKFQVYPATVRYSVSVYSPGRQVIYKKDLSGVGDTAGSPGFDFAANPSKSASKAVEEGVRAAVEDLTSSSVIVNMSRGKAPAQVPPATAKDL